MEKGIPSVLFLFLFLLALFPSNYAAYDDDDHQGSETYIIHVEPNPNPYPLLTTSKKHRRQYYRSFLPPNSKLIYSYHDAINGFAARLTESQLDSVRRKPGFLHAYPDTIIPLLTTHSPDFLGLSRFSDDGLWKKSGFGKGVIVGVLDTGILPGHPSFSSNEEIPPPSNKWRGGCEFNASVCNNKLIGARNYVRGMDVLMGRRSGALRGLPFDSEGHGTHTAGTAAGSFVDGVSVEGQASGTAAGMAPYAHLAIYKVCGEQGCADSDILAGIDRAIYDGVDVMSLSLGGNSRPYHRDSIAIGAFAAMTRGIFVSCASGNAGPGEFTLSNEAPWMLTVGASTIDRNIRTTVELGNGEEFLGESVHQPDDYSSPPLPLIFPGSISDSAAVCAPGSLEGIDVKGKIVVCDAGKVGRVEKGAVVQYAGGAGMIVVNTQAGGVTTFSDAHFLPASHIGYDDGVKIKSYIYSSSSPTASINFKGTVLGTSILAPAVAYFSSRGPNRADPNILKPDIIGPGVNVLAAWPFDIGSPGTKYNLISGTSMATPHLSGIAALLKSLHPDWSPAAIKSAMMTTAYRDTNNGKQIPDQNLNQASVFAIGSGHVNPVTAKDPGLIYDISPKDYVSYLCGMGYADREVSAIARSAIKCTDYSPIPGTELNYPSFMIFLSGDEIKVKRTVTNVGEAGTAYSAIVVAPDGIEVTVEPQTLDFSATGEKAEFTVAFRKEGEVGASESEGSLAWVSSDKKYSVHSPIMVAIDGSSARFSI